jgi:hypothetical protein
MPAARAVVWSRLSSALPSWQNEACVSNNGSVDSLSGHQLRDSLARVKHTRLHGVLWDAGDLGYLINRFLVENVSSFYGTASSRPAFALYVTAGGRVSTESSRGKDRAAQAKDPSIKSAFENAAAGWVALAEQVERIDEEKSPRTRPRK